MMKAMVWSLVVVLGVGFGGGAYGQGEMEGAVGASNAFAIDLYRALGQGEENLLVSPWSIAVALHMARGGARGETAREFERVLHVEGDDGHEGIAAVLKEVERELEGRGDSTPFEMCVANSLWGDRSLRIEPSYAELLRRAYRSEMYRADISGAPEETRRAINGWVEKQTKERIKDLIPEGRLTPETLLVLVNALYFKASWMHPFRERGTVEHAFASEAGDTVPCKMMTQQHAFRYAETPEVQVLELPYAGGASMVVVLPRKVDGLGKVEADLTSDRLAAWMSALEARSVLVKLPRFSFGSFFELRETLKSMGLVQAFGGGEADFSGISRQRLFLDEAFHKTFIAVDEKGTEAAAATALLMKRGGSRPGKAVEFTANHPFLFFIRDGATGTVWFMGRVTDPKVGS